MGLLICSVQLTVLLSFYRISDRLLSDPIMSAISIPRLPTKRSHVASASLTEDPISKRQKTVRTYKSTTTASPSTNTTTTTTITSTTATATNGRYPPSSPPSSIISSSEFLSQPDYRTGPGNPTSALPADFFDATSSSTHPPVTILPVGSRDRATAPPTTEPPSISGDVNEEEWAAFEAEIAETEATIPATSIIPSSAVISAAPTGPGGHVSVGNEDLFEDEAAFDREDAQNKLVQEFEEMESLESRVQKLKEQREALRAKAVSTAKSRMEVMPNRSGDDDAEDDEDDEDDWIHLSR